MNKEQTDAAEECVKYILYFEEDDFLMNLSETHVYFHALVASHGSVEKAREIMADMVQT
jgi:hypothetical protein